MFWTVFTFIVFLGSATEIAGLNNQGNNFHTLTTKSTEKKREDISNTVPNEILVKFKPITLQADIDSIISGIDGKVVKYIDFIRVYHLRLNKSMSVKEAIERLQENPAVEYAEPNYVNRVNGSEKK